MKKFFAIAFIATAMVACNNSGEKKVETSSDTTTVVTQDTATVVKDTTVTTTIDTLNK